ncbi:MAG: class IV adenylate cyclase [Thermocladium sp.]
MFEVEIKYRVSLLDDLRKIVSLVAKPIGISVEEDHYFNHPCRDFAQSDEAIRIRIHGDGEVIMTYKGRRIGSVGKSRMEINLKVDDYDNAALMMASLGFKEVAVIRKRRELFTVDKYTIYLDNADNLGKFVEVETMVSDESLIDEAAQDILKFAQEKLGLKPEQIERRTYLELAMQAPSQ